MQRRVIPQPNDQNSTQSSIRNSFINPFTQQVKINANNQSGNSQNLIDQNIPVYLQRT